jgi:SAM-dependent methyltransferase
MEKLYVKDVYETIAHRFSETRSGYYWEGISKFISDLPNYSLISDAGCGNGRYMNLNKKYNLNHQFIGFDFCEESTKICNKKNFDVNMANTKMIPYRDNIFDATISIAVIHHLETYQSRLNAIRELKRITKPGGKIFIQVWASDVPKTKKFIKINDNNDFYVTWYINKEKNMRRYYHLFEKDEFKKIVEVCGILIEDCFYEHNNWIIIGTT